MSRVFVTGGTGVIGTALVARLVQRGDEVVALARSEAAGQALQSRGASTVVSGDALDEDALASGMAGCELAFSLAGINSLCVEDPVPIQALNAEAPVTPFSFRMRSSGSLRR